VDFFAHQDKARRNTTLLVFYFVITVLIIMATVYFALMAVLAFSTANKPQQIDFFSFHPQLLVGVILSVGSVIAAGSLYQTWMLSGDGSAVALQLGGIKVQPNTRDLDERILLNVVEEMALASGTPVPPVYVMQNEQGINAFAAGTSPQNAVVGVTRGCIETLSRDELQGVIAHEFSHILNGDMKLNIRLMGLLHGILLIAMIGYGLFRIASQMPVRSSGKDDDAKGAAAFVIAMFLFGAMLLGIGYTGVFFAGLIQAAVSRQREFLADASAVQFTRNPLGIAGALKRIGGWKSKSLVRATYAKEASHLFFSQGLAAQFFATHPPLELRIRRIEPTFSGKFETTARAIHSESDVVDPRTLGFQRKSTAASASSAHEAAVAGVGRFETTPKTAVDHIGNPEDEHIEQAHRLMQEIDSQLVSEVHEPFGAMAIIYGLLCAPPSDSVRSSQLELLGKSAPEGIAGHTKKLLPKIDALLVEQRLPLACMALPALDQLSDSQTGAFRTLVRRLIDADRRWTIFEYALQRYITRRIVLRKDTATEPRISDQQMQASFVQVLSTLAHVGGNSHAESAFDAGWQSLDQHIFGVQKSPSIIDRDQCSLKQFDLALDRLSLIHIKHKRHILDALAECIVFDERSTINEVELLRVISDALGCPMPPVLDLAPLHRPEKV
jgi:Zn-dependent protease with chaperone function